VQTNAPVFPNGMPASPARLARVAGIDRHDRDPGHDGLVVQQRAERPQANVVSSQGEMTVLEHKFERQIFKNDCAVGIYQFPGRLVPPVPALIGDPFVQAGDFLNGFVPVIAILIFVGDRTLEPPEFQ
jgi:hypothetical protein